MVTFNLEKTILFKHSKIILLHYLWGIDYRNDREGTRTFLCTALLRDRSWFPVPKWCCRCCLETTPPRARASSTLTSAAILLASLG